MTEKISPSNAYYIDTFAQKSAHEMFNSSLILMCSMVFSSVKCNISKSSNSAFMKVINTEVPTNISFNNVWVIDGESRTKLFLRYIFGAILNIYYLIKCPKNTVIIFPFNNLFCLWLVNIINRLLKRKIIIFCHSEMEGIISDLNGAGILHKVLAKLCKAFFLNPNIKISEGIYFSVSGDIIKENLSELLSPTKLAKFISIDHPYIFKEKDVGMGSIDEKLHIGTVGTLNKIKGFNKFILFVSNISPAIRRCLDISVTGRVSGDLSLLNELDIDMGPDNVILSRDTFDLRIKKLDMILFFYSKENYRITASGAIFDAILHEKPILALKNDYFNYIFKKFGSFGYLEEDTKEMVDRLHILSKDKHRLVIDFKSLKNKFSPVTLSLQFGKELKQIGYLTLN